MYLFSFQLIDICLYDLVRIYLHFEGFLRRSAPLSLLPSYRYGTPSSDTISLTLTLLSAHPRSPLNGLPPLLCPPAKLPCSSHTRFPSQASIQLCSPHQTGNAHSSRRRRLSPLVSADGMKQPAKNESLVQVEEPRAVTASRAGEGGRTRIRGWATVGRERRMPSFLRTRKVIPFLLPASPSILRISSVLWGSLCLSVIAGILLGAPEFFSWDLEVGWLGAESPKYDLCRC
jgi:hypothetical protein